MTGLFEPCDPDAASAAWTNTLVFVGALLSLIGCLVVIVLYLWLKQHRLSIAKRMIFFQVTRLYIFIYCVWGGLLSVSVRGGNFGVVAIAVAVGLAPSLCRPPQLLCQMNAPLSHLAPFPPLPFFSIHQHCELSACAAPWRPPA